MSEPGTLAERDPHLPLDDLDEELLELSCPGCSSDLTWDDLFLSHRICGTCRRHFYISPRERLKLITSDAEFITSGDDLSVPDLYAAESTSQTQAPAQRHANTRERDSVIEAIVTGIGRIGNEDVVIVILDEHATGSSLGALAAEKIILAMELAGTRQLPLVLFIAGGNAPTSIGPLSLIQPTRIASAAAKLHLAGIPTFAIVCQSASSELVGALAGQCDIVLAEPGTRVWHRSSRPGLSQLEPMRAETMLAQGLADDVIDREHQHAYLANALDILGQRSGPQAELPRSAPVGPAMAPHAIASHVERPTASAHLDHWIETKVVIHGDRYSMDCPTVVAGFGRLGGQTIVFAALDRLTSEPASDAAAARKLIRTVGLASRLDIPLLIAHGLDHMTSTTVADSMAMAKLSGVLAVAPVPVVVAIAGDVQSMLSRSLISGDRVLCQSGVTFAMDGRSPGPGRLPGGDWTSVTATEALHLGLIDELVAETSGNGAPTFAESSDLLRQAILDALSSTRTTGSRRRVSERQQKTRTLGQSTPAGRAALRDEFTEFREWQRNLAKSVEDWRGWWDQLRSGQPRLNVQRPDLTEIATRLRARRSELLERAGLNDRNVR
ncbi:MAG: carboxyl transferase domain-containing protein [Thermomicrobiales bacterium]